ncbi:hypothetical protein HDV05_003676 [Chytridiales sp. JEL 0842]|nr:hypothetical protein HDV05_003676 [Chytridiales sp. JEL 0842]
MARLLVVFISILLPFIHFVTPHRSPHPTPGPPSTSASDASSTATPTHVTAGCETPEVRPEWHTLTESQKDQFSRAIRAMAARPISYQTTNPSQTSYHDFVWTHNENAHLMHSHPPFLPYHRLLLHRFSQTLQTLNWTLGLPYWDWTVESQNWWESDVWRRRFKVSPDPVSGPGEERDLAQGVDTSCLRRCGKVGSVLVDSSLIHAHMRVSKTYEEWKGDDGSNYHAIGHVVMGDTLPGLGDVRVFEVLDTKGLGRGGILCYEYGRSGADEEEVRMEDGCPDSFSMPKDGDGSTGSTTETTATTTTMTTTTARGRATGHVYKPKLLTLKKAVHQKKRTKFIKPPEPLPDWYLDKMVHINKTLIRINEAETQKLVKEINSKRMRFT